MQKNSLVSNIFSLSGLQVANYLFPLITTPYVIRTLGVESYGLLAFATALNTYFILITDYGFNLSATKEVSVNRENPEKLSEIFSAVFSIQLSLVFLCFLTLLSLTMIFDKLGQDRIVYLASFGIVFGNVLFPQWLFHGLEKMKLITLLNIASKLIFTISIFIFVKTPQDTAWVPTLTSFGYLCAGLFSFYLIHRKFRISFKLQNASVLKKYLREGGHIFMSRVFVNLYSATNIIILGALTNNTVVGQYSIAEKIINILSMFSKPVTQALYPHLTKLYHQNVATFLNTFKKVNLALLGGSTMLSVALFFSSELILKLVAGEASSETQLALKILTLTIITSPFGPQLTNFLVITNKSKTLSKILLSGTVLNFIIGVPFMYFFESTGLAVTKTFIQYYIILTLYKSFTVFRNEHQES